MSRLRNWLLSMSESEDEASLAEAQIQSGEQARAENARMAESYLKYAEQELNRGNSGPAKTVLSLTGARHSSPVTLP